MLYLIAIPALVLGFAFQSPEVQKGDDVPGIEIPQDVQSVFDKSCMPCHSDDAKNFKARSRLNFDKLYTLNRAKLVNKLVKISDEINEGSMPKKNFMKKHPESVLSADEKTLVTDWADAQADQLVGE